MVLDNKNARRFEFFTRQEKEENKKKKNKTKKPDNLNSFSANHSSIIFV